MMSCVNETPYSPVLHDLRCICAPCCDARRDEALARQEELAGKQAALFEATLMLAKPRKLQPGTLRALVKAGRGR